jgi:hypothetical protein
VGEDSEGNAPRCRGDENNCHGSREAHDVGISPQEDRGGAKGEVGEGEGGAEEGVNVEANTDMSDLKLAEVQNSPPSSVNQTLQRPTPSLVQKYVTQFESDFECVDADAAITLLIDKFPQNRKIEEVLLKVAAVNQLYNAGVYTRAIYAVARLICSLDVDAKLGQGSLALVDEIAHTEITGENHRYVFATKYCHWHRHDAYPIYDDVVSDLLWKYQKANGFATFKQGALDSEDYPLYKGIIDEFRCFYGLGEVSYRQLDKFLWRYKGG